MRSGLAVGVLLGTALTACAAQPPATATPIAATETEIGPLEAGRYTYGGFTPRITVQVPQGAWETFHRDPEFWDVARRTDDGVVALMFLHPPTIIGADGPVTATTADAAIQTLRGNPELHVTEERQVEIDGQAATQLTISVEADNTHMLGSEGALLSDRPWTRPTPRFGRSSAA